MEWNIDMTPPNFVDSNFFLHRTVSPSWLMTWRTHAGPYALQRPNWWNLEQQKFTQYWPMVSSLGLPCRESITLVSRWAYESTQFENQFLCRDRSNTDYVLQINCRQIRVTGPHSRWPFLLSSFPPFLLHSFLFSFLCILASPKKLECLNHSPSSFRLLRPFML